jgi:hypothetical protein
MPNSHYPPPYLRYLRARLWNLGRPTFWVTAIFLSVVGLVTWEYWSNPDIFVSQQKKRVVSQKAANSSLSEENKAIAADIDNLPVLFNDFDQASLSSTANAPKDNTQTKKSKGLLEDVIKKQNSAGDTKLNPGLGVSGDTSPALKNPFVVQTENLLRAGTANNNNPFLGLKTLNTASEPTEPTEGEQTSSSLGIGLTNQTNKNQNSLPVTPLQSALKQSTNQKLSSFNGAASQTNTFGQVSEPGTTLMPPVNSLPNQNSLPTTGTGYTSSGANLPQNTSTIYTNLNGGQVVPSGTSTGTNLPQNTSTIYTNLNGGQVVPNVAPVTPPVTSVAPNNAPYSSQSQGVVNPINPVRYGNYGLQQPTQLPQNNGNYILQQPTQSNSLYLRQIQDKYRSPGQN